MGAFAFYVLFALLAIVAVVSIPYRLAAQRFIEGREPSGKSTAQRAQDQSWEPDSDVLLASIKEHADTIHKLQIRNISIERRLNLVRTELGAVPISQRGWRLEVAVIVVFAATTLEIAAAATIVKTFGNYHGPLMAIFAVVPIVLAVAIGTVLRTLRPERRSMDTAIFIAFVALSFTYLYLVLTISNQVVHGVGIVGADAGSGKAWLEIVRVTTFAATGMFVAFWAALRVESVRATRLRQLLAVQRNRRHSNQRLLARAIGDLSALRAIMPEGLRHTAGTGRGVGPDDDISLESRGTASRAADD
ncbi:MAG: hypothetical protein JWM87_3673 [Candidatus Eremiobacteraeota bacterium]|nr:hypothetical protein [Candidatus Eremiobacteraeota bacterium]